MTPSPSNPSKTRPVVTRFAPSPTGYLHIGGARTALFNWLFSRHNGGKFLLRIEDTDRARHNEQAVAAILDGLSWLGLEADAAPISQYEKRERHRAVAQDLLKRGAAYRCYMTPEETVAMRDKARAEETRFESPWRTKTAEDWPADQPYAVRFKAPLTGNTIIRDAVQGDVTLPNSALDDLIIQRSNTNTISQGEPTYNLAVVVDDHDMEITHIIRGDDHLINAARQQQIYEALDWPVPTFAHIPLIHGPDGKKLSKRHGALGVEAYRDLGYLPEAMVNYLLRLGWAHGDEEILSLSRAVSLFDLDGINKSPARLDFDKLNHVSGHYINHLSDADYVERTLPFLEKSGAIISPPQQEQLLKAAPFLKERSPTLADSVTAAAFITLETPFAVSGKTAKPLRKDGVGDILRNLLSLLTNFDDWSSIQSLSDCLQTFARDNKLGFGQFGPPLRALLTNGNPSPDLAAVLYSLGKVEVLARFDHGLTYPDLG